jgi:hypothetical protein
MFRNNEIIVLIGAGCSADAGICPSQNMIGLLEDLLKNNKAWKSYGVLYNYVKSSLLYVSGIKGDFGKNIDIETLVNTLSELEKKENFILYPFIGNWNSRLLEIAGYDFQIIGEFREHIVEQLKTWVTCKNYGDASYYKKLFDFQGEYNFPLRIFSLNYDLCLEKNTPSGKILERGFDPDSRTWQSRRFDPPVEEPNVYLYKLHGSLDWEREIGMGDIVSEVDRTPQKPDLIFGTDYKLTYVDPYLYYVSEFRKYSLEAKVILVIGYGFNDAHINSILRQALNYDSQKKLYVVNKDRKAVALELVKKQEQIITKQYEAKVFLEQHLGVETLEKDIASKKTRKKAAKRSK